jgi:hypothetical protein
VWCWRAPPPLPPPGDWRRLAYKGDPLLRPIASNEVAPLARLLVGASTAVNTALGLDGVPHPQQEPAETLLQVGLRKGGDCQQQGPAPDVPIEFSALHLGCTGSGTSMPLQLA